MKATAASTSLPSRRLLPILGCAWALWTMGCTVEWGNLEPSCPALEQRFPQGIPVASTTYLPFAKGPEYGCIGLTWPGQRERWPAFKARLQRDGSYELWDPNTQSYTDQASAQIPAQVEALQWMFFAYSRSPSDPSIDCSLALKLGVEGCLKDPSCTFAYRQQQSPGKKGTCQLCTRESCNGRDDDCDGNIDEGGVCGSLPGGVHCQLSKQPITPRTPGCTSDSSCRCLKAPNGDLYACLGASPEALQWTPLNTWTERCQSIEDTEKNAALYCGQTRFLCDKCPHQFPGWRSVSKGCGSGIIQH